MDAEEQLDLFRALVGESDEDEDFHGFTVEETTIEEESDVDFALVVREGYLESDESVGVSSSDSYEAASGGDGDEEILNKISILELWKVVEPLCSSSVVIKVFT